MRNGKVSSLSPFSPRKPRSEDSATGKRKQQTINQFFASKSPKRSTSPIVIEDTVDEITPKKEAQIDPSKNAFSLLLSNSKLLNKKLRALFILELSNGKLIPNFVTEPHIIQDCLRKGEEENYWKADVALNNFRWFAIPTGYRDVQLTLLTNLTSSSSSEIKSGKVHPEELKSTIHISLMKSMIQKGVRRRMTEKVMNLTRQLASDNPSELLRRMVIICLEDVLLHPSVPILVWLMVAVSKDFKFDELHALICVTFMGDLCLAEHRDCYPPTATIPEMIEKIQHLSMHCNPSSSKLEQDNAPSNETGSTAEIKSLYDLVSNPAWKTIIASLFIRASYGGMSFDRVMLEKYGLLWLSRILTRKSTTNTSSSSTTFTSSFLHTEVLNNFSWFDYDGSPLSSLNNWGAEMLSVYQISSSGSSLPSINQLNTRIDHLLKSRPRDGQSEISGDLLHPVWIRSSDLVAEGIDFHCDWNLITYVIENGKSDLIRYFLSHAELMDLEDNNATSTITVIIKDNDFENLEQVSNYLKQVVWIFRSSVSGHRLWPYLLQPMTINLYAEVETYQEEEIFTLKKKETLAGLWRIICPWISQYCERKIKQLSSLLLKNN